MCSFAAAKAAKAKAQTGVRQARSGGFEAEEEMEAEAVRETDRRELESGCFACSLDLQ